MRPGSERPNRRLPSLLAVVTLTASVTHARAQFREPTPVPTDGAASAGSFVLGADPFDNVHVAWVENETIRLHSFLPGDRHLSSVVATNAAEPDLAFFPGGLAIAYAHAEVTDDGDEPGRPMEVDGLQRRICVSSRVGSTMNDPVVVTPDPSVCRHPRVALDSRGRPTVVWELDGENGEPRILVDGPDFGRVPLGAGTRPSVGVDRNDRVHVAFLRAGTIHYTTDRGRLERGEFRPAEPIAPGVRTPHGAPQIGLLGGDLVYLGFDSAGSIYLTDNRGGSFSTPRILDHGGATSLDLDVTAGGLIAMAWAKNGDIHHVLGNRVFLLEPSVVLSSDEVDDDPQISSDGFANVHVAFRRDGRIFLTTDAGPPIARFGAEPVLGEAPLNVRFTDESLGDVNGRHWDFGDGTTSTAPNPGHVYDSPGEYVASLRVHGPGGASRLEAQATVVVTDPSNEMWISDVRAFVGQDNVYVPVLATHDEPAQGFQVAATFDPTVIQVRELEFSDTNLHGLSPEVAEFQVSHDPADPYIIAGVLFDFEPPFDHRHLERGVAQRLVNIVIDVRPGADPQGESRISLVNNLGQPPFNNVLTVDSQSVLPSLGRAGTVHFAPLAQPFPRVFIRGDSDGNGAVNLSDAVAVLNYLFVTGVAPDCLDAADAADNGRVDISDAAFLLNFLFRRGSYPLPPYPLPGLDPTEDDQDDCEPGRG